MRKALAAGLLSLCGIAATAEPVVLAALGDSLTQGYGLVEEDGFVPQLNRWLDAQGVEVKIINAGVSGDTTAGGAARVGWTLTPEVDGMIVALGGNDVLRGIDPAVSKSNLEKILTEAQTAKVPVLLIGMQAPGNYGADYKQAFDAMYPDLATQFGTLYAPSFFSGLQAGGDPGAVQTYMQPDGIHPNARGVALIVDDLGPAALDLIAAAKQRQ
ncbi:arylesterase [Ruegeria arenilitoris]|uniref:arylesterase n=1 Tax=Ruegeria arenilitoris TaxID=1173585 RepID=UPI0020C55868|nr:arylesterase [Ruegeria arenilitoris]